MAENAGTLHDGENYLIRIDEAGTVTLGRDVLVEPDADGFRLSSSHAPTRALIAPDSTVSSPQWTVNLHDEIAKLII